MPKKQREKLLFVKTVAEELSCSTRFVYKLIEMGELQALKLGKRNGFRVKESELDKYLAGCVHDPLGVEAR